MRLVRVTHSFYQRRPFVKTQPTNIASVSQRKEPSLICVNLRPNEIWQSTSLSA